MQPVTESALPVFVYWDQPATMPAYLHWCLDTWSDHGEMAEVIVLNDANLFEWLPRETLNWEALNSYSITEKKDAIQVAILARHGGLFLDADTIVVAPPRDLFQALKHSEVALYGNHMGVIAARPNSPFMARWLYLLQEILDAPRQSLHLPLGNMAYERLRDECAGAVDYGPHVRRLLRVLAFAVGKRHLVRRLDRKRSGFMPELKGRSGGRRHHRSLYQAFWFSDSLPLERVFTRGQTLIGLHNSWNPPGYAELDEEGLMRDGSLLSRTLCHLRDVQEVREGQA